MAEKLTTEQFIKKSRLKHGAFYDYAEVIYVRAHVKVKIGCPKHGTFFQTPADHANRGRGCPECGKLKRAGLRTMPQWEFIEKANSAHNFKYQYDEVRYVASQKNVVIICPEHGKFSQMPTNHLSGKGCPKCADESTRKTLSLTTEQFIEKAKRAHLDKYDYAWAEYINNHTKIKIVCPVHGVFNQTPMSHISGRGCPSCGVGGFKPYRKSFIYVLADADCVLMKVGITNDLKVRLYSLKHFTPFKFEIVLHVEVEGARARVIEKTAHKMGVSCGFKGFQGCTEWFRYDSKVLQYLSAQALGTQDSNKLKLLIDNVVNTL